MASISLLDLQPHKVSRDLRGYSVMFYGAPKTGKTTIASRFPGALLLAFEKGYNALPGIFVQPMDSWNDFKKVIRQLKDSAVAEKFSTIVIDTADIAYNYCVKYICSSLSTLPSQQFGSSGLYIVNFFVNLLSLPLFSNK